MARIAFFELEGWEEPHITRKLRNHDLILKRNPLTPQYFTEIENVEVLSVFIYSKIDEKILNKLPKLRAIVTRSTGFDHIDINACRDRGIAVFNVPAYGTSTVAEFTMLLILMLMRKIKDVERALQQPCFTVTEVRGHELAGKTIGIIGTGRIGGYVAKLAHAFGMKILAYDLYEKEELKTQYGVRYVDLDTLLSSSDIITLHVPYTPQTHHLINRDNIKKIKKGAIIVNTARGSLIETEAIIEALEAGILSGVALDVVEGEWVLREENDMIHGSRSFSPEELRKGLEVHLLMKYPNVILTPHIAYNTWEAVQRILDITIETIKGFFEGKEMPNRIV